MFKIKFFCHFWFSIKKIVFFELQTYFCFPHKISRLVSQIQQQFETLFFFFFWGGGGEKTPLFTPPKNLKVRFRQHCRKMRKWKKEWDSVWLKIVEYLRLKKKGVKKMIKKFRNHQKKKKKKKKRKQFILDMHPKSTNGYPI